MDSNQHNHQHVEKLRKLVRGIRKKEEIDSSLRTAKREQLHMLPNTPQINGYDFAATYIPAGEIGGDFYDFVRGKENRLSIIMGDVTGHGIEAAIIMGMAKKTMAIYSRGIDSAAKALAHANSELYGEMLPSRFVSIGMILLDVNTHTMQFARAGHNPLVIFNLKRPKPYQEISPKGTVLGIVKTSLFMNTLEVPTIQLYSGDFVLLYTDGITEAHSPAGEEFGLASIREIIERNTTESVEVVLQRIVEAVEVFTGTNEFEDDITLVAFRLG